MLIKEKQELDDSIIYHYTFTDTNNQVIWSFTMEHNYEESLGIDEYYLGNVYVQPKYRNNGYFNELMIVVLEDFKQLIHVKVDRNSFILDKYLKLGFKYSRPDSIMGYDWYSYDNKKESYNEIVDNIKKLINEIQTELFCMKYDFQPLPQELKMKYYPELNKC